MTAPLDLVATAARLPLDQPLTRRCPGGDGPGRAPRGAAGVVLQTQRRRAVAQPLTDSGERAIRPDDLQEIGPVVVTTPLRAALDPGRLQPTRDLRLAGMDAMASLGLFTTDELEQRVECSAGRRGVVQLRLPAPMVDGGAPSQAESSFFRRSGVHGVHADADLVLRRALAAACASSHTRHVTPGRRGQGAGSGRGVRGWRGRDGGGGW